MKTNFDKFQRDFFAEVESKLPKFYDSVNTLMVVQDKDGRLGVLFEYTDVTGKKRNGNIKTSCTVQTVLDHIIYELNAGLMAYYPGWAQFETLQEAVAYTIEMCCADNSYNVEVEGKVIELTIGTDFEDNLSLFVTDGGEGYLNYDIYTDIDEIVEDIMFEEFGVIPEED